MLSRRTSPDIRCLDTVWSLFSMMHYISLLAVVNLGEFPKVVLAPDSWCNNFFQSWLLLNDCLALLVELGRRFLNWLLSDRGHLGRTFFKLNCCLLVLMTDPFGGVYLKGSGCTCRNCSLADYQKSSKNEKCTCRIFRLASNDQICWVLNPLAIKCTKNINIQHCSQPFFSGLSWNEEGRAGRPATEA